MKIQLNMNRNSGVEILRLFLMFCIVLFHIIGHGSKIMEIGKDAFILQTGEIDSLKLILYAFLQFPVDCFIIISGFYGIKLKAKKIFKIWLTAVLISITIFLINSYILKSISIKLLIKSFLPLYSDTWWFLTNYIILMLISPFLNHIDEYQIKNIPVFIGILIIIDFIFKNPLLNFIICYLIGKILNKITISNKIIIGVILLSIVQSIVIVLMARFNINYFIFLSNYWPLSIFQAIIIFILFKKIYFFNEGINFIASASLGIYLISDHAILRNYFVSIINPLLTSKINFNSLLKILSVTCIIYFVSLLLSMLFFNLVRLIDLLEKNV